MFDDTAVHLLKIERLGGERLSFKRELFGDRDGLCRLEFPPVRDFEDDSITRVRSVVDILNVAACGVGTDAPVAITYFV
jgi:hypothetical protein